MLLSVITPMFAEVTLRDVFVDLGGTCGRKNSIYAKGMDYFALLMINATFMNCGCDCLSIQELHGINCTGFELSWDECVIWLDNACFDDSSQDWFASENLTTYSINQSKLEEYEHLEELSFLRLMGCKTDESEGTPTGWRIPLYVIFLLIAGAFCVCINLCLCLFCYFKNVLLQSKCNEERKEGAGHGKKSCAIKHETKCCYGNTIRTLEGYDHLDNGEDWDDGQQCEEDLKELDVWKFSEELTIVKENIGYGSYGVIHVAHGAEESTLLAVKEYHQMWSEMNAEAKMEFIDEIKTSTYLQHRNVVRCFGFTRKPAVRFVMEYCEHGSCVDARNHGLTQRLSDAGKVDILIGACRGLVYLCKKDIVHRDIAARNILLDQNFIPKIADFGRSRKIKNDSCHRTLTTVGPLKWMSPESIQEQISDFKSDVWSFGVTMWEIMEDKEPYPDMDSLTACIGVIKGLLRTDVSNINTKSPALAQLILSCFKARDLRPSMTDIYRTLEKIIKPLLKEEVSIVDKFGSMKSLASGAKLPWVDAQNSNRIIVYDTPKVPATEGTVTANREEVVIYSNVPLN